MSLEFKNFHPVIRHNGVLASLSTDLVLLRWLFNDFWFCRAHEHWQQDGDLKLNWRMLFLGLYTFAWSHQVDVSTF